MTVKIQSASPSLGLVDVNGGVRFVARAYLTATDFIFWWDVPTAQLVHSYFYGKDFVDALNAIMGGASSAVLRYIVPQSNPADDYYRADYSSTIYGARLSSFIGLNRVCTLSQNDDDVSLVIPNSTISTATISIPNSTNMRVIDCFQDAARGENNAVCAFNSSIYGKPTTFFRES